jgi:molybdenum cofactor cytidylyltransferase
MAHNKQHLPPVAAVILAAGGSIRMGTLKQLLLFSGVPMVRRVAEAVCSAEPAQVVVVVGARAEQVTAALAGLPLETVCNPSWSEGMSGSLRVGLERLRPEVEAALVVLADQPGLSAALIHKVMDHYQATRAPIVVPVCRGQRGNPVLWDRVLFAELCQIEGDKGGRTLLDRDADRIEWLETGDPAVISDIDTWQDYVAQTKEAGRE